MSSKRAIRRKACEGKIRYTRKEAARHAAGATRNLRTMITNYKCRFCGGWHIGHPPKRIRRAMKAKRK